MQVSPQEEDRHDEPAAPSEAVTRIDRERHDGCEQGEREHLRPHGPGPGGGEQHHEEHEQGRARRCSSRSHRHERDAVGEERTESADEGDEAHPSEPLAAVQRDMGEPLLVRPGSPVPEHRQVVVVG